MFGSIFRILFTFALENKEVFKKIIEWKQHIKGFWAQG